MAEHSVDYIIRLVADDKELKQKLSSGDFLNKKEISKIKQLLSSTMDAATRDAKNLGLSLQDGLDVDTSQLEKTLQFISGVFDELEKTGSPIKDWAKTGTGVYKAFDNLQTSVASLAQNVNTLQTGLNNLTSSFQSFQDAYKSFKPTQFINVAQNMQQVADASAKINANTVSKLIDEKAIKRANALKTILSSLSKDTIELNIADDDLDTEFGKISDEVYQLTDNIEGYKQSLRNTSLAENERKKIRQALTADNTKLAQSYLKLIAIEERQMSLGGASLIAPSGDQQERDRTIAEWEEQILSTAEKAQKALSKLETDINSALGKSFAKVISEQISDIQLKLTLPNEQEFVSQINDYISRINDQPLSTIRVNIDDAANIIEDQSKQKHKDKPASDDVYTDKLVEKTNQRFDKVITAISEKQQKILDNTNTWRQDMIAAMKIAASDLEFEFGWDKKVDGGAQLLKDAIQTYFDMPGNELNIHINHKALADEIKSVVSDGGFAVNTGGSTSIANLDKLVAAMSDIMFGKNMTTVSDATETPKPIHSVVNNEEVLEQPQYDDSQKRYVTQLDASSASVQELISRLQDFANMLYGGKRVSAGAKELGDWFTSKGIDLHGLYKNTVTPEQLASQLTEALLVQDEMGYAKGSTIASDLRKVIRDNKINTKSQNGIIIDKLPDTFQKMLSSYGVITETVEEWKNRIGNFENVNYNIKAGRSLGLLNRARYPFNPDKKRDVTVDGGMWDVGNDLNSVITNLQEEKANIVARLQKDRDELAKIRSNAKMSKGDKQSQYQKDYIAAQQIYTEAISKRKQAESALENARKMLSGATTDEDKKSALQSYKEAKANFDVAKQQEREAEHFEIETLGVWQNARNKVKKLLSSIESNEAILESFESLESMQYQRVALGDNPTEEAMAQFKSAGVEFYEKSKALFTYLNSKFKFKGVVALDGSDELISIKTPNDILKHIPENARITYVASHGDHSTSAFSGSFNGSSNNRSASFRKANSQEQRMTLSGGKPEHLVTQQLSKAIIDEVIDYAKFHTPAEISAVDISGDREQQKIQQRQGSIHVSHNRFAELGAQIREKEQELLALKKQDSTYSSAAKQSAVDAVERQSRIVGQTAIKQQQIEEQLTAVNTAILQAKETQSRLQREFNNVSEVDVQRAQNAIQSRIQSLEEVEPSLTRKATSAQTEYDISKSVYEYADKLVKSKKIDFENAKEAGNQDLVEELNKELEFAISERSKAQIIFQTATKQLNEANNALQSNLTQRQNLQTQRDNISIDSIRADKQLQLDTATANLQALEDKQSILLRTKEYMKESYSLVADELYQLKQVGPYKITSQIEMVQGEIERLQSQKKQVIGDAREASKRKQELVFLSKKLELQRHYNALQEKSLQLQTEIIQLDESDDTISTKRIALAETTAELQSTKTKIMDLGGFITQGITGLSQDERHQYGLNRAIEYQKLLDIAYQQMDDLPGLISSYAETERQINKYGSKQFDVQKAISIQKQSLRNEFADSDYVKAELEVLKAEAQKAVTKVREDIAQRMRNLAVDVDPEHIWDYIHNDHPELREDLEKQERAIWDNYKNQVRKRRNELLAEFEAHNLTEQDGIVSAIFKVNKDGQWVNGQRQTYDVKQDYLKDIIAKKTIRQQQLDMLPQQIADLEQQKLLAMTYGNVQESELVFNAINFAKKHGQAIKTVDEVISHSENLSQGIDQTAESIDKYYINYEHDNRNFRHGGLLGALNGFGNQNITIDTSHLATEDTLSAIYRLLGGEDVSVAENPNNQHDANLHLSRNAKDPTDLDINPSVQMSQDIEKKLIETVGKSLSLEELRKIIGAVAGDLFAEQGDPTRALDRDEFYEKNYNTIFEKALDVSKCQLENKQLTTQETTQHSESSVDSKMAERYATRMLTYERTATYGSLDERKEALNKREYSLHYDDRYAFKEARQDRWQNVRQVFDGVSTFLKGIKSDFVGDVRSGDFSKIDTYLQAVDTAEQKLQALEAFFERIKNVDFSYKQKGQQDMLAKRNTLLGEVNNTRDLLTKFISSAFQQAVTQSMANFKPIYSSSIDIHSAEEIKTMPLEDADWSQFKTKNGETDWDAICAAFKTMDANLTDIESGALYFARMEDFDGLKKAQSILAHYRTIIEKFESMITTLPDSKDKKFYDTIYKADALKKINDIQGRIGTFMPAESSLEVVNSEAKAEEVSKAAMTIEEAISIVHKAIGTSTAKTTASMAKVYASKIHENEEAVKAAKLLYNTPDDQLTSKFGRKRKNQLIKFRDAWANTLTTQSIAPTEPVEECSQSKENTQLLEQISQKVNELVSQGVITTDEGKVYAKFLLEAANSDEGRELDHTEEEELNKITAKIENFFKNQLPSDDSVLQLPQTESGLTIKPDTEALPERRIATEQQNANGTPNPNGGLIGIMRTELAKESTLKQVLTTLGEIAKKNALANMGKPNSAQDLLEQFRRMLESDSWEGKERVAYLDLETGLISNSITGTSEQISVDLLKVLRDAYKNMDIDAMVHTHANQEDPYFSSADFELFGSKIAEGITKQILLSKNNMTVLDMTDVKDVNGLLEAMANTEQNFEALATTAGKFGAKYVSKAFDEITPQGLVKMLGIKGIESKYTEAETHDASRKGVLAEDVKKAADMLQESTGRAIKKTVERVGLEFETWVEKTDTKGNKTWSSQINNKFEKAMKATNKDIERQHLDSQFGSGTKAAAALETYRKLYQQLTDYVKRFNESISDTDKNTLQQQINDLIPTFNKAEKELIDLIARKEQFLRVGEKLDDILSQDTIGKGALEAIATREFFGDKLTAGQNIATAGTQSTKNGRQLLVDILDNGTISRYGIEVDEVTGQVRKLAIAEGDLANAFQNVNRAMRNNTKVVASVAIGDNEEQIQEFLNTASSPAWNQYKTSLLEMKNYTVSLWNTMKNGGSVTQKQLDYLMALSERVMTLGDNIKKTSIAFKNFQAYSPENVISIGALKYDSLDRDKKIRESLEARAKTFAKANNSEYTFSSFGNDTLQFTLTDVEGQIRKITYEWNELYQQIAITSDKSTGALDPLVAKINQYNEATLNALNNGYLMAEDTNLQSFLDTLNKIQSITNDVVGGKKPFDTVHDKLYELRQEALKYGELIQKTITQNKNLFASNHAKEVVATFTGEQLGAVGDSLKGLATQRYSKDINAGDNIAFNGLSETPNGTRLLVDVLKNETIQQYALEVDKATGQVKEFMVAENALANAFQNVNKAMRNHKKVMASVAIGDTPDDQADFMSNANSESLNAYMKTMGNMRQYVADIWKRMAKGGASASQQELDYIMTLSESVIALGKNIQKTSIDFKNFKLQNPDSVIDHAVDYQGHNRDEKVRESLEAKARSVAKANNSEYTFSSFDSDTLQFTLTDIEGKISKITYKWNELYKQIAITSDKSTSALDPIVAKIQMYDEAFSQAVKDGYLSDEDINLKKFNTAIRDITSLVKGVNDGIETFDTVKDELYLIRQEALKYGEQGKKIIAQNKRLFAGTGAKKSVDNQYNKIIGARQASEAQFTDNSQLFTTYNDAYTQLNKTYQEYVENHQLNDPKIQQQIQQEALKVQALGRRYLSSVQEAEKLKELVEQSGIYKDKKTGADIALGGITNVDDVKNLKTQMLDYVQNGLRQADIQTVKFDATNQRLTYSFRTSKNTLSDMVVQYNDATKALYAYQKQEYESLTGLSGFLNSMKGKMKSILQYIASITSIYRVFGELKRGIQYIREIDSALTELKKVTDETEETYNKFLQTAAKTADKVGSTIKEVVSSTADFARLGYNLQEAAQMAESAQILMNVSEFTDINTATDTLISAIQAFSYTSDESMHVVDIMNTIGNQYAISTADLASSLTRSSAALVAAGNSMEEAVALTAAANTIIQDADSVGKQNCRLKK